VASGLVSVFMQPGKISEDLLNAMAQLIAIGIFEV